MKENRALVSIIMGVYNGETFLREAMDSILAQTYQNWELIVCNDGSADDTGALLKEYASKDPRVRVITHKVNKGLASSLNDCLEYVRGEYIARMDCDDKSVPNRLERQVDYLDSHRDCDLVGTFMQAFSGGELLHVIETKEIPTKYDLPKGAPFAHATIMVRTSVMKALGGYCVSRHTVRTEDVDLWYRFFAKGYRGVNIPEVLYLVRMDSAAYQRRKLKYMLNASYIIWYGCDMVDLPAWYKIFCLKPILSWLFPAKIKIALRKILVHKEWKS